jgi:LacI family transcriptional regulator
VDGAIILAHNISDAIALEAAKQSFPLVVLDRRIDHEYIFQVEVDNTAGAKQATEFLITRGHRQIAYISGPPNARDNKLRYQGFRQALEDYHLSPYPKWEIASDFTREGGYRAVKLLIAQRDLPQAVFFANDEMAIGGLQAFRENQIQVPEDISIIGFDDIQLSEYLSPPLTTVRQPKYEAGSLASHLIFRLLDGEQVDHHYKLMTDIVERKSVRTSRV